MLLGISKWHVPDKTYSLIKRIL